MKNNHPPAFCLTYRNHIISTKQSLSINPTIFFSFKHSPFII